MGTSRVLKPGSGMKWALCLGGVALLWFFPTVSLGQLGLGDSSGVSGQGVSLSPVEFDALAPSFVVVKLHYKRSEEEVGGMASMYDIDMDAMMSAMGGMYASYIEQKVPQKLIGIAVAPDLVMTIDTFLDENYLDYIEVDDMQGGVSRAERHAILTHAPGLLVKIKEPEKLKIQPAAFVDLPMPVGPDTKLYELKMEKSRGDFLFRASSVVLGSLLEAGGGRRSVLFSAAFDAGNLPVSGMSGLGEFVMGTMGVIAKSPTLIVNADKKPVGVGLVSYLPNAQDAAPLWRGKELMDDARITFEDLRSIKKDVQTQFEETLHEIRITFRQKAEKGLGGLASRFLSGMIQEPGEIPKEMYCYGLPISPRVLFVPRRIQRSHAKVIDKVTLKVAGKNVEGKFYGAYEDLAAFLIRVDENLPSYRADRVTNEAFETVVPMITVRARRQFGGKKLKVNYTRTLAQDRGYKDLLEYIPLGQQPTGTFFTDRSGKVRAVFAEQRKEDEEQARFRAASSMFSAGSLLRFVRLYTARELADHFTSPRDHFDKAIVSLPEEEEKQKMWLGVEFEPITPELAKSLGVEKFTKDGTVGLIISAVYPNSPAQELGLQTGDILLKVKEVGRGEPIELTAMPDFDYSYGETDVDVPREIEAGYQWPKQQPWKVRINLLTSLLDAIGENKAVELTYLTKDRKEVTKQFTVKKAPPDFESAAKVKDDDVGLTVKEITYEVRNALMLPKELNAVVVAKVEEGSPAAVARVRQYELLLKIDDTPITGMDSFKKVIAEAKKKRDAEGKVTLRLTVQQMGKSRFADLTLEK